MKKPLPILSMDNSFTFGGSINSLYHLFRTIDKSSFLPIVVSGQPPEFLKEEFSDCIYYHFIPKLPWIDNKTFKKIAAFRIFRIRILQKILNMSRFAYWLLFITFPESLRYYKISKQYGVVLIHLNNGLQIAGVLAAKLLRVPCVSHLRGFSPIDPVTKFVAGIINHHVAISAAIRENLLELGVPEERITLVHDAIDISEFNVDIDFIYLMEEFGLSHNQPAYGFFGRVVKWKGVHEFILAAQAISLKLPEARGFIVGDASDGSEEYYTQMRELLVELGLEGKVIFTGYRRDIPAMMALMDVIVHSSVKPEPFGMVIIEGMAMQKPVVATRAGGTLDIVVEGQTGYLVEAGDPTALSNAVIQLLSDPELCQSMGKKARTRVEQLFHNKLYAKKMEDLFFQLIPPPRDPDQLVSVRK